MVNGLYLLSKSFRTKIQQTRRWRFARRNEGEDATETVQLEKTRIEWEWMACMTLEQRETKEKRPTSWWQSTEERSDERDEVEARVSKVS
uniref:Uncharacterized protein n=1 Tax=Cucumis melo TaxID=3656 RepID=A0A9I9DB04_CUCME